jgi:hypothetical protein
MSPLRETIAVVDKSGKIVDTSKQLFGIFKEARNAYRERKAEIAAEKQAKIEEKEARRALETFTFDDSRSAASRNEGRSRGDHHRHSRHQDDFKYSHPSGRVSRHHTVHHEEPAHRSAGHIDMDLEEELQALVFRAKRLLAEADCVQRSATATIAHLQRNPEAMAAVALTLAEISTLVSKMAPRAVASLRASAPTVFALLASPQFLIAAGVGIGVTVVMFGGSKIIKKIAAANDNRDELVDLQSKHLSRVEAWRRGVADAEASSVGRSVDGEFITPVAAEMRRSGIDTTPRSSGGMRPQQLSYLDAESRGPSRRPRRTSRG